MSRVLFATSNGTGLGHLTRCMAIARRLPDTVTPVLLTLSQAMPVARREGFHAEFLCSYEYGTMDGQDWNVHYERRLGHLLELYAPDLVVFDGVYPYVGLIGTLQRHHDTRFVWSRRGMWKQDTGGEHLRDARLFSAVLEPGEYAGDADRGPTAARRGEAHLVSPIVYLDPDELLDRETAAGELGLDPSRPAALIQLGSGSVRSIESAAGQIVQRLRRVPDLQVTVAESIISGTFADLPDGVHRARVYPLSRYSRAFDFAVAAPGYNLFHEALAYHLPTLFVPKRDVTRDDQEGRAAWAAAGRIALHWDPRQPSSLDDRIDALFDPRVREDLRAHMARLPPASGAREAAEWLTQFAKDTP